MKDFNLIGHRGYGPTHNLGLQHPYNQKFPENSILAFKRALSQGADGIEFDVQVSSDGVAIALHDKKLNQHAVGLEGDTKLDFDSLSYEELRALDIGGGSKIPSLAEVIELCTAQEQPLVINFDVKDPRCIDPVISAVDKMAENNQHFGVVSSYDWELLAEFRRASSDIKLVPAVKTFVLFGRDNVQMPGYVPLVESYQDSVEDILRELKEEIGFAAIDCTFTDFRPELIEIAAKMGVGLQISTGNNRVSAEETDYETLLDLKRSARSSLNLPFVVCKVDEPDKVRKLMGNTISGP